MGSNLKRKPDPYSSQLYKDRSALKEYRSELYRTKEFCIFGIWCLMELVMDSWFVSVFMPDTVAYLKGNGSPKETISMTRNWILDQKWTVAS